MKIFIKFMFLFIFSANLFGYDNGSIEIHALTIQADQKIVCTGFTTVDNVNKILIARYTTAGLLDSSFNNSGIVINALGGTNCAAQTLVINADNNIYVSGICDKKFCVGRFDSNGVLDTTFNSPEGCVTTAIGDYAETKSMCLDASGNIIVAGLSIASGSASSTLACYSSMGVLDTSFGTSGITTTKIGNRSFIESIILQADGKIIAAGWASIYNSEHVALTRYNSNGLLDTTFGAYGTGIVTTQVDLMSHAYSVALQTDGKIVVAGESQGKIIVIRYTSAGALDTSFGAGGIVTTEIDSSSARANEVKITTTGEILVTGFSETNGFIVRYTSLGAIDTAFGVNGFVKERGQNFYALAIQADGKLVAVGSDSSGGIAIFRYLSSGAPDTTFGSDGQAPSPGVSGKSSAVNVAVICDERAQNVSGGTFDANAWRTRVLNKIKGNLSAVSLLNNRFKLQPGKYLIQVAAPAYKVSGHKCRLQNVTDSAVVQFGATAEIQNSASANTISNLTTYIALSYEKEFEVQHYASSSRNGDGFGKASNFPGANEIYTQVTIVKLPES